MTSNERRAAELAGSFREQHELGDRPLDDLFDLVHATLGCDVLSLPAGEAEHGLTMRDPDRGTVVVAVATTSNPMRQRTSVAHELGHVLAGDLELPASPAGERTPQEIRADAFARHLLLPLSAARRLAQGRVDRSGGLAGAEPVVSDVCQQFGLSPHAVAIQLKELGLLAPADCDAFRAVSASSLAARYGWAGHYQALQAAARLSRAPQSLMAKAVRGYASGVLGLNEVAAWYGEDPQRLLEELEQAAPVTVEVADKDVLDDDPFSGPLFPDGPPTSVT